MANKKRCLECEHLVTENYERGMLYDNRILMAAINKIRERVKKDNKKGGIR